MIESVQRKFTNRLSGMKQLSYPERLSKLGIDSLETRRLKSDLCMYYNIIHKHVDLNLKDFFLLSTSTLTRGHNFKLVKPICSTNFQLNQFSNRCINAWNSLTSQIVNVDTIFMFKRYISTIDFSCLK